MVLVGVFSDRFVRLFVLSMNALFIAFGGISICYGVYKFGTTPAFATDLNDASSDGTLPIISGILDVIVGTCGVIGTLAKKRACLIANAALLAVIIVSDIILIIFTPIATTSSINDVKDTLKKDLSEHYGNKTHSVSFTFTADVDHYMREEECCGFTGVDGENVFKKTPWHQRANQALSAGEAERTLPPACCKIIGAECEAATDIKAARKNKTVFENDCLDELAGQARSFMILELIKLVIVALLRIVMVFICVLAILREEPAAQ